MTSDWRSALTADPLPWLLEPANAAVRRRALADLADRPPNDAEVREALAAAMTSKPIAATLAAQEADGHWAKPGPGYDKYRGTVWSLMFLDQLGADPDHPGIQRACDYVLGHTQTSAGGFGAFGGNETRMAPPSSVVHCLNGNLLRAMLGFGRFADERIQRAIQWQADAITGEGDFRYYASGTTGPLFGCTVNNGLGCAWGGTKALLALARIPEADRTPPVVGAIERSVEFLLSHNPAVADYPSGNDRISPNWFKLGFPSGYVADVLQTLEALAEAGYAKDPRLTPATEWLLSKQCSPGRWRNEYAYNGKTWVNFERQGQPSKWVTLRACRFLKAALG